MTTLPDLLYVALFAVTLPLVDYLVFWPAFRRRSQANPARARIWLWAWTIIGTWLVVAVGAALWTANDRSWASLRFSVPEGWRLWTAIAIVLLVATYYVLAVATLARSSDARERLRQQFGPVTSVIPHTQTELYWFGGVSVTAGFCEEFLFRGYFICVLSPWLGWWGAAALSLALFAVAHLYQGWSGVLRTGIFSALYTLVVAISNSLWPAIALHALVDLAGGVMAWLALRERPEVGDVVGAQQSSDLQSAYESQSSPVQAEPGAASDRCSR